MNDRDTAAYSTFIQQRSAVLVLKVDQLIQMCGNYFLTWSSRNYVPAGT